VAVRIILYQPGCSAVGSAPRLGRGGRRFKSAHPDHSVGLCPTFHFSCNLLYNYCTVKTPFLSLILPAHNEEQRLSRCLVQVDKFLREQSYDSEVIVVENGSSDKTLDIGRSFLSRMKNLKIIHLDDRGKGLAVQTGMLSANGEYRFFADVDFSMPVTEINRFIPPILPNAQVTIASREAPGAIRYNEPAYRHFTGRVFNALVRWMAVPSLQDTQCGFKCFRHDIADEVFNRQSMMGWSFDAEILFIAMRRGYTIVEVPIPWYFNSDSKVRLIKDSFRMAKDIASIRRNAEHGLYD
jgi:dolichyl-phosphate beta-glucosyltransferase